MGQWCYIPMNWERKQMSKVLYSYMLCNREDGFRVCMYANKNSKGELTHHDRIKVNGRHDKEPVLPNSLCHVLKIHDGDVSQLPFLLKAIDYYEDRMKTMLRLVRDHASDIGFTIGAASLIFMIDFAKQQFSVKFIDFGVSFPLSDMRIWPDELPVAVEAVLEDLKSIRNDLIQKHATKTSETDHG